MLQRENMKDLIEPLLREVSLKSIKPICQGIFLLMESYVEYLRFISVALTVCMSSAFACNCSRCKQDCHHILI